MKAHTGILTVTLSTLMLLAACSKGPAGSEPNPDPPPGDDKVKVTGVSLNKPELLLAVDDSETLSATVSPSNAGNKRVTWSSSSSSVASVDADGKVTALKAGRVTVTVKTVDGSHTATCSVTVTANLVAVTGVKLEAASLTIAAEDQKTLTATVTPSGATNKKVAWSSSDPTVATVDAAGKIIALRAGATVITASSVQNPEQSTDCNVTVTAPDPDNLLRTTHIPDPVFLDYCRRQMTEWDTNKDGKLYAAEAAAVRSIDVANIYGNTIYSLRGIEYFTGLTYLDCSLNNLTSLDVSQCTRLSELYCNNNNRLSSLDLSGYTVLTVLNCSSCSLTEIDLSRCTRLIDFSCFFNDIASLDLSACTNLNYLDVDGNELTTLDLSKNRSLKGLICDNNRLTSLDLSACTALTSLDCYNNRLTALDLSKNSALINLSCDMNRLTALDVSKNGALESLICNGNLLASIQIGEENARLKSVYCSGNLLTAEALNTIFTSVPYSGTMTIYGNPGSATCDTGIAVQKNWLLTSD
jgi:Leucine-rich repeat (LRR) protein